MSKMSKLTKITVFYRFNKRKVAGILVDFAEFKLSGRQFEGVLHNSQMERSDTIILGNLAHFRHFRHSSGLSGVRKATCIPKLY